MPRYGSHVRGHLLDYIVCRAPDLCPAWAWGGRPEAFGGQGGKEVRVLVLWYVLTLVMLLLSNFATLKGWPAKVVAADLAWGTALTTVVSLVAYYPGSWIGA